MSADRDEWDYGPFKVGDVVELCNALYNPELNGTIVSIVKGLGWKYCKLNKVEVKAYQVSIQIGMDPVLALSNQVRRRKPPMTGLEDVLALFKVQPRHMKEVV